MKSKKVHIGLYLAAKPEAGGIYQYALSLIEALSDVSDDYELSCFVEHESWKSQIPEHVNVYYTPSSKLRKGLGRIVRRLSFKLWNNNAKTFNKSIPAINKSGCDLVIYPSQDSLTYQTNIPAVTAVHDLMHRYESHFSEYQGSVYEERERHYSLICENAAGILVDSELGKKQVIESYNIDDKKVQVLPFTPPLYLKTSKEVDVKKKYQLPEEFVFYPAQFWEHKNHEALVQTCKILKDQGNGIHFVFIGSVKNNYDGVIQAIDTAGLKEDISILGYIPQDEMYSFYKQAKAMVFASLAGPTNIPPMEAMTLGCPAIVSNAYAMPEQVGEGALLVDARDPAQIAEKITLLLKDENLRNQIIEAGYSQIKKWDQSAFKSRLEQILNSVQSSLDE